MILKLTIDAFHASEPVRAALEQVKGDRLLEKCRFGLHAGGLAAAAAHYHEAATPQMVIVEETGDSAALMRNLAALAEVCEPGTKVIVIGAVNDIHTYRKLINEGVSDYLVAPLTAQTILDSLLAIFSDPLAPPRGRMIAFYGARGGVGSSTLAQNTAWALAKAIGEDVIYLELDQAFGTASLAFNIEARQTISDALATPERIDAVLIERCMVKYDDHLQILPSSAELRGHEPIQTEALDKLLDLARQMAAFVVVDVPHLWAPWVHYLLTLTDDLVIVATPDLPNLRDCKSLLDLVGSRRGDAAPTRILLNRVDAFKKTQLTAKDFQENLKVQPLLSIPFDPVFGLASNNGQMIGEAAKGHKIAESLSQLALQLSGRQAVVRKKRAADLMAWLKKSK